MNRIVLLIPAGTPVFKLAGVTGSLVNDATVDFGLASRDELAQAWANDTNIDREQRLAFLGLLTHTGADGRPVKYTPQGNPVSISQDQDDYSKTRELIELNDERIEAITSPAVEPEKEAAATAGGSDTDSFQTAGSRYGEQEAAEQINRPEGSGMANPPETTDTGGNRQT